MACEKNGMGRMLCVDPEPSEFLQAVQGVELSSAGFRNSKRDSSTTCCGTAICCSSDSTHTVKHDSGCLHIYLRILPTTADGAIIPGAVDPRWHVNASCWLRPHSMA